MPTASPPRSRTLHHSAFPPALHVARGDVVCFLDADSEGLGAHFAGGLAGPVACGGRDGDARFTKLTERPPIADATQRRAA